MIRAYAKPPPLLDVIEEYIGEAAFLYAARRQCLVDPELSWEDLPARERRLDANLEGLVLGGIHSARLLKEKLTPEADAGEAFAAAAVYPSLGLIEPMQWLTQAIAAGTTHYRAIVDGLLYNEETELNPWAEDFLGHASPFVRAAGAEILAKRQTPSFVAKLTRLLEDGEPRVLLTAASAVNGKGGADPRKLLFVLNDDEPEIVDLGARWLFRAGYRDALRVVRQRIKDGGPDLNRRLVLLLGACGEADDHRLLGDVMARQPEIQPECILALGLLGSVQSTDYLISRLADPSQERSYVAAVNALRMISGKEWLPDFDLEEVQPKDIVKFQELWRQWHAQTGAKLQPNTKYRLGAPLSPSVLLSDLRRRGNPKRDLSFLELKFRYGCPVDFQHDGRYSIQLNQLKKIEEWMASMPRNQT